MKQANEKIADRDAEIRVMRREREDSLMSKVELTLENKRLRVSLIMVKLFLGGERTANDGK